MMTGIRMPATTRHCRHWSGPVGTFGGRKERLTAMTYPLPYPFVEAPHVVARVRQVTIAITKAVPAQATERALLNVFRVSPFCTAIAFDLLTKKDTIANARAPNGKLI